MSGLRIKGLGEEIATLANLPWDQPLENWPEDEVLTSMRGISRHVVRLIRSDQKRSNSQIFAVKETVSEFANREYTLLRDLNQRTAPVVEPVAVIEGRLDKEGNELAAALVTKYLPYSLPYRVILSSAVTPTEISNMANALALLLVRMHLIGFWWGDCSLSNTLFRRDANDFSAYLVDAETGEFHKSLSDGQREHDLELTHFNVAAELEDLAIAGVLSKEIDPVRASDGVIKRYRRLWKMLKEPQILDASDRQAVERAMRSLQDLGFAVEEVEVTTAGDKGSIRFQPKLVAARYHANRLYGLMGLQTEELQAKRLLASYDRYKAREFAPHTSHSVVVKQWLADVFRRVVNQVPDNLKGRVEPAQLFHEVLENRWYLGEKLGKDVGLDFATADYIEKVLPYRMDSGVVINR
ncbi:MAG: DUF4032 domain-containing protein [Candidatus Nanopelagicaceae bacterium]|nr:DUF4032 domain-containing protein [Candidatus Nanopelagicaceae bacterium]